MNKIYYFFCGLFRVELDDKWIKEQDDFAEIDHRLYMHYHDFEEAFLEKHGKKLRRRPRWKSIKNNEVLVCTYLNPLRGSIVLQFGILYTKDQYKRFVSSLSIKKGWWIVSKKAIEGNSLSHK